MFKRYYIYFLCFIIFSSNSFASDEKIDEKKDSKLKGSMEGGITIENGNTKTESYYGSIKSEYDFYEKWKNLFNSKAHNQKENRVRTKEEYRVNNQTRYSVTKLNYSFLELEYVDDRFGGYDYRISETMGLGRSLIKEDNMSLTSQISTGLRQTKFSDGDKDDSWVIRFGTSFNWKINSTLSFSEDFDFSIDDSTRITKSDTNLKIALNKSLYLKFNLFVENKSDVPQGIKNTDTRTMLVIGFSF